LRPEEYANFYLRSFLKNKGTSEKDIHDSRVNLRKYLTIAKSTYVLHGKAECIVEAKKIMKKLGKIRDMDAITCLKNQNRDLLAVDVVKSFNTLENCFLSKLYGSRLVIIQSLYNNYIELLEENEFHKIRKLIRESRFLIDSLGYSSLDLKDISQELGNMRDKYLFETECEHLSSKIDYEKVRELKEKALIEIRSQIMVTNFIHVKELISRYLK